MDRGHKHNKNISEEKMNVPHRFSFNNQKSIIQSKLTSNRVNEDNKSSELFQMLRYKPGNTIRIKQSEDIQKQHHHDQRRRRSTTCYFSSLNNNNTNNNEKKSNMNQSTVLDSADHKKLLSDRFRLQKNATKYHQRDNNTRAKSIKASTTENGMNIIDSTSVTCNTTTAASDHHSLIDLDIISKRNELLSDRPIVVIKHSNSVPVEVVVNDSSMDDNISQLDDNDITNHQSNPIQKTKPQHIEEEPILRNQDDIPRMIVIHTSSSPSSVHSCCSDVSSLHFNDNMIRTGRGKTSTSNKKLRMNISKIPDFSRERVDL